MPGGEAMSLLSGKGHYTKLTWDEKQTQLVFFSDKESTGDRDRTPEAEGRNPAITGIAAATKSKLKIYHWDRNAAKPRAAGPTRLPTSSA